MGTVVSATLIALRVLGFDVMQRQTRDRPNPTDTMLPGADNKGISSTS